MKSASEANFKRDYQAHLKHLKFKGLQHVLPKGFRRARNFGFLHPNSKQLIQPLHVLRHGKKELN